MNVRPTLALARAWDILRGVPLHETSKLVDRVVEYSAKVSRQRFGWLAMTSQNLGYLGTFPQPLIILQLNSVGSALVPVIYAWIPFVYGGLPKPSGNTGVTLLKVHNCVTMFSEGS